MLVSTFTIPTRGPGLHEFTGQLREFTGSAGVDAGVLTVFVQHTSCSLLVQENADPDVRADLQDFFARLAPSLHDPSMRWVRHRDEGPDDMPAHIRAALLPTSIAIPVIDGRLALGPWQGVFLFEHRDAPHRRNVVAMLQS